MDEKKLKNLLREYLAPERDIEKYLFDKQLDAIFDNH